ncbi:MAG: 50S ribosomal protein L24 [Thermoprotei archaeon]
MSLSSNRYKQRRNLYNTRWNSRVKLMGAPLAKDLRSRLNLKSIPVRVNDTVKVVTGGFKGRSGKVARVNLKKRLVYIEGVTGKAQKGKTKLVGIHVSNLLITKLDLSDKYRKSILQRKGVSPELLEREPEISGEEKTEGAKPEAGSNEQVTQTGVTEQSNPEEKKESDGGS